MLTKKISFMFLVLVLFLGILAGCNKGKSSSDDSNGEKDQKSSEITVGVEAGGPYTEFYKDIVDEFTQKTGVKVNFIEIPHDSMHQRFLTEAMSATGSIDVYQTDQPWISEFAAKGFLEPLSDRISEKDLKDFVEDAIETVKYKDEIYALPYLVHTPIVYYRTDLFEKAGLKTPPATWDEYRNYAKKLNNIEPGVHGTIIEGKQTGEPVTHLLDVIHQSGGGLWDKDGNVIFNSPEVKNAFKYLVAIQHEDKTSPSGAVGYDNADVHNLFMQGKVAMVKNWPYMYALANNPESSKVAGKFSVAVQPKGQQNGSAIWSWGYGISSDSKNKDAAWEFVKWATSSEVVQRLGTQFINPVPRHSALEAISKDAKLTEKDKEAITIMSEAIVGGVSFTETPKFPSIQERLAVTLSRIMSQPNSLDEELKATADDIQEILKR